jgi:hypothetical protein
MIGFFFGLPVEVVFQVLVLVELETHEYVENGH